MYYERRVCCFGECSEMEGKHYSKVEKNFFQKSIQIHLNPFVRNYSCLRKQEFEVSLMHKFIKGSIFPSYSDHTVFTNSFKKDEQNTVHKT